MGFLTKRHELAAQHFHFDAVVFNPWQQMSGQITSDNDSVIVKLLPEYLSMSAEIGQSPAIGRWEINFSGDEFGGQHFHDRIAQLVNAATGNGGDGSGPWMMLSQHIEK